MDENQMINNYIDKQHQPVEQPKVEDKPQSMEDVYRQKIYDLIFNPFIHGDDEKLALDKIIREIWQKGFTSCLVCKHIVDNNPFITV